MVRLYKDPNGETVMELSSTTNHITKFISDSTDSPNDSEVAVLKQQISDLENKLAKVGT